MNVGSLYYRECRATGFWDILQWGSPGSPLCINSQWSGELGLSLPPSSGRIHQTIVTPSLAGPNGTIYTQWEGLDTSLPCRCTGFTYAALLVLGSEGYELLVTYLPPEAAAIIVTSP